MAEPIKVRNATARAAWERRGAGKHADRRTKRLRTRAAAKRAALRDA